MEKLFEKLFKTQGDGETPLVPRAQAMAAFNQLYHVLLAKQSDKSQAAVTSFNQALAYLSFDL